MVAIKKITNAFNHHLVSRKILRELKLLRILKHENVVEIRTIILPRSRTDFQDIYIVFELMDTDGSGGISLDELETFIHKLNPNFTDEQIAEMFRRADNISVADNIISYEEFCLLFEQLKPDFPT